MEFFVHPTRGDECFFENIPVVRITLGRVYGVVGQNFINLYFEFIFCVKIYFVRNVVTETVKGALMNRTCKLAIDFYFGIGHRAFKNNIDRFVFPFVRNLELMLSDSRFISVFMFLMTQILLFLPN